MMSGPRQSDEESVSVCAASRRVLHFNVTRHPTADWTLQQFRECVGGDEGYRFVIHDRDRIYSRDLDAALRTLGLTVLKNDTVPLKFADGRKGRDIILMDPPKFVGPIVEAVPGLRSKTVWPINCAGKKAHEWWVGSFVSSNGIPSKVIEYMPSLNPRKNVLY